MLLATAAACGPGPVPTTGSLDPPAAATDVTAGHSADASELLARIRTASTETGEFVRDLAAASAGPPTGMAAVGSQIQAWAAAELAWLDERPADRCLAEANDAYRAAVDGLADAGARWVELGAQTDISDVDGAAAVALVSGGRVAIEVAEPLAEAAVRACPG